MLEEDLHDPEVEADGADHARIVDLDQGDLVAAGDDLDAGALADAQINVNCVSQTLRQVNMQFIIERSDYKKAIIALNHALCVSPGTPVPRA